MTKVRMGSLAWMCIGIAAALSSIVLTAGDAHALVAKQVIDGDTIELENGDRVRLIGIDAPEIDDKFGRNSKTAKFEGLRKTAVDLYAIEAKAAAQDWLKNQKIRVQKDPVNTESAHRDNYGRLLAYICRESDDRCLAEDLLSSGHAVVYRRFTFNRKTTFLKLEEEARSAGRGVWKHRTGKAARSNPKPAAPKSAAKKKTS